MKKILLAIGLGLLLVGQAANAQVTPAATGKVTLAWDTITDPSTTGVKIYYGTSPGSYGATITVGPTPPSTTIPTSVVIPNLINGVTYYFSATAFANTSVGVLESDFSPEVSAFIPFPPPATLLHFRVTNTVPK